MLKAEKTNCFPLLASAASPGVSERTSFLFSSNCQLAIGNWQLATEN